MKKQIRKAQKNRVRKLKVARKLRSKRDSTRKARKLERASESTISSPSSQLVASYERNVGNMEREAERLATA
jgi:phage host-nuclease inhibitor protein Gam